MHERCCEIDPTLCGFWTYLHPRKFICKLQRVGLSKSIKILGDGMKPTGISNKKKGTGCDTPSYFQIHYANYLVDQQAFMTKFGQIYVISMKCELQTSLVMPNLPGAMRGGCIHRLG